MKLWGAYKRSHTLVHRQPEKHPRRQPSEGPYIGAIHTSELSIHWIYPYIRALIVVYFDQLSGAERTQKLVETFFKPFFNLFCSFQSFFLVFKKKYHNHHIFLLLHTATFIATKEITLKQN